ncbi:MAG TPA: peroxiredoxin [Nocardioidaceae bacterium]|nr:peroxiredoxin [Nocardioidaceae bacterium]
MTLETGSEAPGFALRDQHGQLVELASLRGRKAAVLMFYPYAFSRVCTGELWEVRDSLPRFESAEVQLLAISCDPMFTLRAFADADRLEFPLLSDFWPHGEVARAYDVFDEEHGCARRSTFIVDRDGVLRWSVHNQMSEARDLGEQAEILAKLAAESG